MALEPPPQSNNRFALLNDKPQPKRAKRNADVTQQGNPKYIRISSNEEGKRLSDFSCFALHRAIKTISKETIKITELKDGNLLILVKPKPLLTSSSKAKNLLDLAK